MPVEPSPNAFRASLRRIAFATVFAATLAPGAARAEPGFDMSTLACSDWLNSSDEEQELMVAWLRGYLAGHSTSTIYDTRSARLDRQTLAVFCQHNPTVGVISAASKLPH